MWRHPDALHSLLGQLAAATEVPAARRVDRGTGYHQARIAGCRPPGQLNGLLVDTR
jgi:hypothetical protein